MKLAGLRGAYQESSGKASDISRQLGFAGIALIWLFRESSTGSVIVSKEFLPAAILIVIGLGLDLLQYITGSAVWGIYHRLKERAGTKEGAEFEVPPMLNWPLIGCYWGKLAAISTAYVILLTVLFRRLT